MTLASVLGWIGPVIVLLALALVLLDSTSTSDRRHLADGLYAVGLWMSTVACALDRDVFGTAVIGLFAAYYTWRWWKGRRKGRGRTALKALGDKSRRRVQALVEQMTPSPIPSPVGAALEATS